MRKETFELWNRLTPGTCIKLFDSYGHITYVVLDNRGEVLVDLHVFSVDDRYYSHKPKHRWKPFGGKLDSTANVTARITVCAININEEKLVSGDPEVWVRTPIGRKRTLSVFTHARRIAIASDSEIDPLELEAVNLIRQYLNQDGSKDHRQRNR